jgi:anti-sigma factor RsiW
MNCDAVQKLIPLYYYGELSPDEEDRVEAHVFECATCAHETERQRSLAAALDRRSVDPPPSMADDCRANLMLAIQGGAPIRTSAVHETTKGPWRLFLDAMADTMSNWHRWRQPVMAAAMLALGFFAARVPLWRGSPSGPPSSSVSPETFATVKSVVPDSSGRVQIAYDETQRRVISGRMDDQNIQRLLVAGLREENPDVRVQAVDLLKGRADSSDVRDALLNRLANDPNPGVRLKALDGLKPLAAEPEVRKTLAQVLLADDNPAVRMQAVDLLIAHRDDSMVGVLQNVVQREDNNYVRSQCEKALKELNASLGTF